MPTFTLLDAVERLPYSLRDDDKLQFLSVYDHVFADTVPTTSTPRTRDAVQGGRGGCSGVAAMRWL